MQRMTAKDFQRNIGRAQHMALREPLTITFHGNEHLVLLSAEDYRQLKQKQSLPSRDQSGELIAAINALKPDLEEMGVEHLAIFGSTARGENRLDSDLDIAIETSPQRKFTLLDQSKIQYFLSERLGKDVDVVLSSSMHPYITREFKRDGIRVF